MLADVFSEVLAEVLAEALAEAFAEAFAEVLSEVLDGVAVADGGYARQQMTYVPGKPVMLVQFGVGAGDAAASVAEVLAEALAEALAEELAEAFVELPAETDSPQFGRSGSRTVAGSPTSSAAGKKYEAWPSATSAVVPFTRELQRESLARKI